MCVRAVPAVATYLRPRWVGTYPSQLQAGRWPAPLRYHGPLSLLSWEGILTQSNQSHLQSRFRLSSYCTHIVPSHHVREPLPTCEFRAPILDRLETSRTSGNHQEAPSSSSSSSSSPSARSTFRNPRCQILNLHGGSGPRPDPATYTTHADKPCAADSACKCMTLCRPPPSPWPIAAARAVTTMMPFSVLPSLTGTRSRRN